MMTVVTYNTLHVNFSISYDLFSSVTQFARDHLERGYVESWALKMTSWWLKKFPILQGKSKEVTSTSYAWQLLSCIALCRCFTLAGNGQFTSKPIPKFIRRIQMQLVFDVFRVELLMFLHRFCIFHVPLFPWQRCSSVHLLECLRISSCIGLLRLECKSNEPTAKFRFEDGTHALQIVMSPARSHHFGTLSSTFLCRLLSTCYRLVQLVWNVFGRVMPISSSCAKDFYVHGHRC